jgi:amidase
LVKPEVRKVKFEDKANVIYSFSARHQPVAELAPGEVIVVETADCYSGQVHQAGQSLEAIDHRKTNPATGPFYVSGTEPGDTLVVEILEIKTAQQGIMVVAPNMGVLGDQVATPELRLIKLHETSISFGELTLPLQPMLGVIGVAPEAEEAGTDLPGPHGGNLDTKEIRPGSKVYLPVFHPGALLALGDVHALMGDGEVSGTAVETSAEVKIRVDVIKGQPLDLPRVKTEQGLYFLASAREIPEAMEAACRAAVCYLMEQGHSPADAYMLAGAAGQLQISQVVNPLSTVKFFIPKYLQALHK